MTEFSALNQGSTAQSVMRNTGKPGVVMAGLVLACPGHPRLLSRIVTKDVNARDEPGHDEL
jgi:hypothetical protein